MNLVDVVDAVGDVFEAVHESVEAFLADPFKHLFTLLGTPSRRLKLIGCLLGSHLDHVQPTNTSLAICHISP